MLKLGWPDLYWLRPHHTVSDERVRAGDWLCIDEGRAELSRE